MGAGSTRVTAKEQRDYYNETHPKELRKECKYHYPIKRHDLGIMHFLNNGKPYIIEQCPECKREYVKEL